MRLQLVALICFFIAGSVNAGQFYNFDLQPNALNETDENNLIWAVSVVHFNLIEDNQFLFQYESGPESPVEESIGVFFDVYNGRVELRRDNETIFSRSEDYWFDDDFVHEGLITLRSTDPERRSLTFIAEYGGTLRNREKVFEYQFDSSSMLSAGVNTRVEGALRGGIVQVNAFGLPEPSTFMYLACLLITLKKRQKYV